MALVLFISNETSFILVGRERESHLASWLRHSIGARVRTFSFLLPEGAWSGEEEAKTLRFLSFYHGTEEGGAQK